MMVGAFRNLGDLLHELDAVQELLELDRLADGVVLVLPSGQRLQLLRDLFCAEFRHGEDLRMPMTASFSTSILVPRIAIANPCGVIPVARACGKTGLEQTET